MEYCQAHPEELTKVASVQKKVRRSSRHPVSVRLQFWVERMHISGLRRSLEFAPLNNLQCSADHIVLHD